MATRDQILATIDAHAEELRSLGAGSLALFGAMARGEKILDHKVDLVLAAALKPRLRPAILAEAVHASRL